jgi:hypothetical protein
MQYDSRHGTFDEKVERKGKLGQGNDKSIHDDNKQTMREDGRRMALSQNL